MQLVQPKVSNGFFAYAFGFGKGDCGRIDILLAQTDTKRSWYYMELISNDNGRTIKQMVKYCKRF